MKKVAVYSIIIASAIAVGATAGIVIKRFVVAPDQTIIGFNADACKPDGDALIKKFNAAKNPRNELEPYELVLYSQEMYKRAENSVSYCYGLANAVAVGLNVVQDIRSAQVKIGNKFYEEQVSKSSQVAVSKRMYLEGKESNTRLYKEKDGGKYVEITQERTTSQYEPQKDCTPQQYKELYGRELPDMFIYIIHSTTVDSQKITDIEGGYQIDLTLKPAQGGYNYRYQMVSVSDLEGLPVFQAISLCYKLSSDYGLKSMTSDEQFIATKMGFNADTHNQLEYRYFQGKEYQIPDLDQDFDYKTLKEAN